MTHYESVVEFMELMGQNVLTEVTEPTSKLGLLRYNLIAEEVQELEEALMDDDYTEVADALADILYVGFGAYAAFGMRPGTMQHADGPWVDMRDAQLPTFSKAVKYNQLFQAALRDLMESLGTGNMKATNYALDDINDLAYKMAFHCGIDIYKCFDEVHASNMSKACLTRSDAESSLVMRKEDPATAEKYVDAEVHQVGERFILRRKMDGKVLKGRHYFDPDLSKYLNM